MNTSLPEVACLNGDKDMNNQPINMLSSLAENSENDLVSITMLQKLGIQK